MKTLTMPVIPCHDTESIALSFHAITPPSFRDTTRNPIVYFIVRVLMIIGLLMAFSSESMAGHSVTYNGNTNTSGTVPVDTTSYNNGNSVSVLNNSGNLVKTNYVFSGWNTNSGGTGTTYQPNETFDMGTVDVTLYAKWVANPVITPNIEFGCSYTTGISVFDGTGTVSTAGVNTKLYQGDDNYNIGVDPSKLTIQGGAQQCIDGSGGAHTCVGNSTYAPRIDLGTFPTMPVSGDWQTLQNTTDILDPSKNNITIQNLSGANTVQIKNSVMSEIHGITIQNNADVKLVYDGTAPFRIKTLNMNSGNGHTLYMEPGTYFVENFGMQAGSNLVVTGTGDGSGVVRLLVKNDVSINATPSYYNYNTALGGAADQLPEKLFIASYTGDISVQAGANVAAYLYADNGDVWVGAGPTNFVGGAVANNITFQDGVQYYYLSNRVLDDGTCAEAGTVIAPSHDQCGMFPSVLTADNDVTSTKPIECSMLDPGTAGSEVNVINTTTISAGGTVANMADSCTLTSPPEAITLPSFLHSTNLSTTQTLNADTLINGENVNNISIGSNNITVTFTATATPYSDSTIKVMKMGTVVDNNKQGITYVFNEGDYWIEDWNMNGNSAVIQINGKVRFFIANDFTAESNTFSINTPASGIASNFYMYSYNDILFTNNGFANSHIAGYLYAARDVVADGNSNFQTFTGAIRAGRNINLQQNQTFTYDGSGANGNAEDCTVPSYIPVGLYDAWDTSRSISDRNISTKIVSENFTLTLVSLNSTNTALESKAAGIKAYYRLYDFMAGKKKTEYTDNLPFDPNSATSIQQTFNVPSASKDVKVEFKFCADYNGTAYILKSDTECSGKNVCSALNTTCYRETVSTDAFAIRPDRFVVTVPLATMKAGEDYNITVNALDNNNIDTQEYDQTVSNLTGAPKSWWNRDTAAQIMTVNLNTQGTTTIAGDWNITNGAGLVPIRFSDVGKFTLDLNDTNWAAVDVDDTALSDRTVHGEGNVTFIPFDFNISVGTIVNNDGASPSFTYLSSDLNMSARIPISIRAQNKQGSITLNYANNLYDRNITITPYVSSTAATARGLTPLTQGATNSDGNFISGTATILFNDPLVARFNFDRNQTIAVSPFDVNSSNGVGNDVNISVSDSDSVYGDKNQTLGNNATFIYGRFVPRDIRVFGATTAFIANGWYEVFNAPTIGTTGLAPSKNGSGWYINTLHSDQLANYDGDANVTYINTAAVNIGGAVGTDGMEDYNFGATTLGSYKAHINTDPWLWYGPNASPYVDPSAVNTDCLTHPCFNINVVPPVGASGSAKTDATGDKANKKSDSSAGSTGFKSTNDYAPAVR